MINEIYNEDCLITMKNMTNSYIDGIITSPPYSMGSNGRKDGYYNNGYLQIDNLSQNDYLELRLLEFIEMERILKDEGVICYNISYSSDNPILPTLLISKIHNETNFTISDIISWKKPHSIPFQGSSNRLSRLVELVYIIVKKDFIKTFKSNKEVSTINSRTGQKFYRNYVNFIEAKNNDGFKCKLKASYSQELVDKLIHIYFPKGYIIYDPFSGIGTTQLSCIKNGLNYIGSELDKEHFDIMKKRISEFRI